MSQRVPPIHTPIGGWWVCKITDSVDTKPILDHEKDPNFWHEDGNIRMKISPTKYANLHLSILRRYSGFFRSMLKDLKLDEKKPGLFECNDPKLDDSDFQQLLKILYPSNFTARNEMTAKGWGAILRASTRLEFDSIKKLSIEHLCDDSKATPFEKIKLGHLHNVPQLLLDGYVSICQRKEPLTDEEGAKLDLPDLVRVMRAREQARGRPKKEVEAIVKDIFGLKIQTPGDAEVARPPTQQQQQRRRAPTPRHL